MGGRSSHTQKESSAYGNGMSPYFQTQLDGTLLPVAASNGIRTASVFDDTLLSPSLSISTLFSEKQPLYVTCDSDEQATPDDNELCKRSNEGNSDKTSFPNLSHNNTFNVSSTYSNWLLVEEYRLRENQKLLKQQQIDENTMSFAGDESSSSSTEGTMVPNILMTPDTSKSSTSSSSISIPLEFTIKGITKKIKNNRKSSPGILEDKINEKTQPPSGEAQKVKLELSTCRNNKIVITTDAESDTGLQYHAKNTDLGVRTLPNGEIVFTAFVRLSAGIGERSGCWRELQKRSERCFIGIGRKFNCRLHMDTKPTWHRGAEVYILTIVGGGYFDVIRCKNALPPFLSRHLITSHDRFEDVMGSKSRK